MEIPDFSHHHHVYPIKPDFELIKQKIAELEALIATESRHLTVSRAKEAMNYAHTFLSDNVAEWVRTAEKVEGP